MNIKNLKRARAFLLENRATIEPTFSMKLFREGSESTIECNSVGCIVGWTTALDGENISANYMNKYKHIDFSAWSIDFYTVNYNEWSFLFAERWESDFDLAI